MSRTGSAKSPLLRTLFPSYWRVDSLIRDEVVELSDEILDWTSDRWAWSLWSIRQQTNHIVSVPLRWLIGMWGDQIFVDECPVSQERYDSLNSKEFDRRLDNRVFWEIEYILGALNEVVGISRQVLVDTTIARVRSIRVERRVHEHWKLMRTVHPDGVSENPETGEMLVMDLVATFRHIQNEFYTHLFNVQRGKIALGIEPIVKLPDAGYHTASGWHSEIPILGAALSDFEQTQ